MAAAQKKIFELSLEGKGLSVLPDKVAQRCGGTLIKLDLTDNTIKSGENFEGLTKLEQLVLDKNDLQEIKGFPTMRTVNTLWLNKNCLSDLELAIREIANAFPNLTYLSMLFNPCVPNLYLDDSAADSYNRYRLQVIAAMPLLQFLDSTPVDDEERKRASKINAIARPKGAQNKPASPRGPGQTSKPDNAPPKVATFLAKGKPRYDGTNSEGNRFIMNDDL